MVRTLILMLIAIMSISTLALVSSGNEPDSPSTQPIPMHNVVIDRAVFLEMAIREQFGVSVTECFLGTSSWIGHRLTQGSDQLKQAFLDTKVESTCCAMYAYGHLVCALFAPDATAETVSGIAGLATTPARLLTAITGHNPTIVQERRAPGDEL